MNCEESSRIEDETTTEGWSYSTAVPDLHGSPDESGELLDQIRQRRTFAIISHPDAGKTTLTEKLLLYSGCLQEAGAVRGKGRQRATASDWMEIEQKRGISVTSTVLSFSFRGILFNLLDTPGHDDFCEETFRTLSAVDCAVMILDIVKGVEQQTRKLFRICAARKIPVITFVNKLDRPGGDPLAILEEVEEVLGIDAIPLNWPMGIGKDFTGVFDRVRNKAYRYDRVQHGSHVAPVRELDFESASREIHESGTGSTLLEDLALLDGASVAFDHSKFLAGTQTPVYYGSALASFGVEPVLDSLISLCPPPGPRMSDRGPIAVNEREFGGVVFKIQGNLDPRHRDRMAFIRICSGRFERNMEVTLARTGERIHLKQAHRVFARDRDGTDEACAGDVVGLIDRNRFRLGDTLFRGGEVLHYDGQWDLAPECFARIRCLDTSRRKQFTRGLDQLVGEGVVRLLHDMNSSAHEPLVASVGRLQMEVVEFRLKSEFQAPCRIERQAYSLSRWIEATPEEVEQLRLPLSAKLVHHEGMPMVLFTDTWDLKTLQDRHPDLRLMDVRKFSEG